MRRAVIFDLDGTLVDSLDDIAGALIGALVEHGHPAPAKDAIARWVGDGARALVERAVGGADGAIEPVYAAFRRRYTATPIRDTRPYPGILELLDALAPRAALGVLSNKPHALTVTIVEALFPGRFAAVAGERPGVPRKPDAAAGLAIARELGTVPTACVLVGDSEIDVAAARAAGMRAVAVTWGLRPRAVLVAAGPDLIADHPSELHDVDALTGS